MNDILIRGLGAERRVRYLICSTVSTTALCNCSARTHSFPSSIYVTSRKKMKERRKKRKILTYVQRMDWSSRSEDTEKVHSVRQPSLKYTVFTYKRRAKPKVSAKTKCKYVLFYDALQERWLYFILPLCLAGGAQSCTIAKYTTVHTTCESTSPSPGIKISLVLHLRHQLGVGSVRTGSWVIYAGSSPLCLNKHVTPTNT